MSMAYMLTPFAAWLVTGCAKFTVNCIREGRLAFDKIGYGGFPSNHAAIVGSTATLIGLREGVAHPAFGVAVALAFIVLMDANSLRRQIGRHAEVLNSMSHPSGTPLLRERMGHSKVELLAGLVSGSLVAMAMNWLNI